jgi:hypothetical protein
MNKIMRYKWKITLATSMINNQKMTTTPPRMTLVSMTEKAHPPKRMWRTKRLDTMMMRTKLREKSIRLHYTRSKKLKTHT